MMYTCSSLVFPGKNAPKKPNWNRYVLSLGGFRSAKNVPILANRDIFGKIKVGAVYFKEFPPFLMSEEEVYEATLQSNIQVKDFTRDFIFKTHAFRFFGVAMDRSAREIAENVSFGILKTGYFKYPRLQESFITWRKGNQNTGFLE